MPPSLVDTFRRVGLPVAAPGSSADRLPSRGPAPTAAFQSPVTRKAQFEDQQARRLGVRQAQTGKLQQAQKTFEDLQYGRLSASQAARRLESLGLSAADKRDLESYSRARSRQVQAEIDPQEQVLSILAGPNLAKLAPGGSPASEANLGWAAAEAAMFAPGTLIGRPIMGAVRGARAVRGAKGVKEAAESLGLAGRNLRVPEPRTVRYGELETQFPNSPSIGTRYAQKLWDKASVVVGQGADVLRQSENIVARGVGAAITPVSARARVPKQAGKLTKKEASRRRAAKAEALRDVRDVGGVFPRFRKEPVRVATFWFAQLPKAYRNADGLRMVKAKQTEILDDYTSGAFSESVNSTMRSLQATAAALRRGERVTPVDPDAPLEVGDYVRAADRDNYGRIEAIDPETGIASVHFVNTAAKTRATVQLPLTQLSTTGYRTLEAADDIDPTEIYRVLNNIEELKAIQADIPDRIRDLTQDLRKLEITINRLPRLAIDEQPIEAMRELMHDRRDILVRAGKLDPGTAGEREGLVSRWLGLEPDGTEVYIGHRMDKVRGQRPSGLPAGVSLGKTRLPEGVATQNTLQLLSTGRARKDLMSVIEDWQAAQVYEFHNIAKDDLAKLGEKIIGRPKAGYVVVNPLGHTLPRKWNVDDAARAAAEGLDAEDVLIRDTTEYLTNYLAEGNTAIAEMLQTAAQAGHLEDLRQVPADVAKRYFSQFLPTKIQAATPGLKEGANLAGKTADWINDIVYTSLIYSSFGYIPAAAAANLILTGAQQGAFLPSNIARAGQLLVHGPPKVRDLVRNEVGGGMAVAVASGTPLQKLASGVSAVGDEPWRVSAFLHEAARIGVIPKVSPVLTKADYRALEEFLTSPKYRAALNDVSDRATQAVLDFNRLGSKERAVAKRLLFVWGFLRAAARLPGRFALDHPIRSAVGAGAAYAYQDEIRDLEMEDMPSWARGTLKAGERIVDGVTYPAGLATGSYDPFSPLIGLARTATGDPDARTFFESMHPAVQALAKIAGRQTPSGFEAESYRESAKENLQRLVPWVDRASNYISPPSPDEAGLYPEDVTRLGRLRRDVRVLPVAIDPEEAAEIRQRELSRQGKPKVVTLQERTQTMLAEERTNARKLGLSRPTPQVLEAVRLKAAVETYIDALDAQERERGDTQVPKGDRFKLTPRQKAAAALAALRDTMPPDRFDYSVGKANLAALKTSRDVERFLDQLRRDAYNIVLDDWHGRANAATP